MSVTYLKHIVGCLLPECLADLCLAQPQDPIEYIARWLYKSVDAEIFFYEKAILCKEVRIMVLEMHKENTTKKKQIISLNQQMTTLKHAILQDKARRAELLKQHLKSTPTPQELFGQHGYFDEDLDAALNISEAAQRSVAADEVPQSMTWRMASYYDDAHMWQDSADFMTSYAQKAEERKEAVHKVRAHIHECRLLKEPKKRKKPPKVPSGIDAKSITSRITISKTSISPSTVSETSSKISGTETSPESLTVSDEPGAARPGDRKPSEELLHGTSASSGSRQSVTDSVSAVDHSKERGAAMTWLERMRQRKASLEAKKSLLLKAPQELAAIKKASLTGSVTSTEILTSPDSEIGRDSLTSARSEDDTVLRKRRRKRMGETDEKGAEMREDERSERKEDELAGRKKGTQRQRVRIDDKVDYREAISEDESDEKKDDERYERRMDKRQERVRVEDKDEERRETEEDKDEKKTDDEGYVRRKDKRRETKQLEDGEEERGEILEVVHDELEEDERYKRGKGKRYERKRREEGSEEETKEDQEEGIDDKRSRKRSVRRRTDEKEEGGTSEDEREEIRDEQRRRKRSKRRVMRTEEIVAAEEKEGDGGLGRHKGKRHERRRHDDDRSRELVEMTLDNESREYERRRKSKRRRRRSDESVEDHRRYDGSDETKDEERQRKKKGKRYRRDRSEDSFLDLRKDEESDESTEEGKRKRKSRRRRQKRRESSGERSGEDEDMREMAETRRSKRRGRKARKESTDEHKLPTSSEESDELSSLGQLRHKKKRKSRGRRRTEKDLRPSESSQSLSSDSFLTPSEDWLDFIDRRQTLTEDMFTMPKDARGTRFVSVVEPTEPTSLSRPGSFSRRESLVTAELKLERASLFERRKSKRIEEARPRVVKLKPISGCRWHLEGPRLIVCSHPLLGVLRSPQVERLLILDNARYWEQEDFHHCVFYDHEIYTLDDPRQDDGVYEGQYLDWDAELERDDLHYERKRLMSFGSIDTTHQAEHGNDIVPTQDTETQT